MTFHSTGFCDSEQMKLSLWTDLVDLMTSVLLVIYTQDENQHTLLRFINLVLDNYMTLVLDKASPAKSPPVANRLLSGGP